MHRSIKGIIGTIVALRVMRILLDGLFLRDYPTLRRLHRISKIIARG